MLYGTNINLESKPEEESLKEGKQTSSAADGEDGTASNDSIQEESGTGLQEEATVESSKTDEIEVKTNNEDTPSPKVNDDHCTIEDEGSAADGIEQNNKAKGETAESQGDPPKEVTHEQKEGNSNEKSEE